MKKILLVLLLIIPTVGFSQDVIIKRNGEQIDCRITKVDSTTIYFDFQKGERTLSTYIAKSNVRNYLINSTDEAFSNANIYFPKKNSVIIDTSKYVKETYKWSSLITYSQRFGLHAKGWSVQYYGYSQKSTSKWMFPVISGIERFEIDPQYFSQSNYQAAQMSYFLAGISPFCKLNDYFYLRLGANFIFGSEELIDNNFGLSSRMFVGMSPIEGIYFISKSNIGITLGVSAYEKLLSSKVYKNDIGLNLELGIKF